VGGKNSVIRSAIFRWDAGLLGSGGYIDWKHAPAEESFLFHQDFKAVVQHDSCRSAA
jgi:hypothetical protein